MSLRNYPVILPELSQAVYGVIITHLKVFNLYLVTTDLQSGLIDQWFQLIL